MALITRITRLFKADVHAIIDSIEEPVSLLKQSVREMEDLILEDERRLASNVEQHQRLNKSIDEVKELLANDGEELDLCFENNNEELARTIIKRRLERMQFKNIQEEKVSVLVKTINELNKNLVNNRLSIESMRQKAEILIDNSEVFVTDIFDAVTGINISQDDIELAMLREKKKRSQS